MKKKKSRLFRDSWKDYFSFPKREKHALMFLFTIILAEIVVLVYLNFLPNNSSFTLDTQYDSLLATWTIPDSIPAAAEVKSIYPVEPAVKAIESAPVLFHFDPNELDLQGWVKLGFSPRQSAAIIKYRNNGGEFRNPHDLKKLFVVSPEMYNRLEPYMVISKKSIDTARYTSRNRTYETEFKIVDVGIADTIELDKVKGIGPVLAWRIYDYRNRLGGFTSINQMLEVRGITDSLYQVLRPQIELKDSTNIRRININTAPWKELVQHPYMNKPLLNQLIRLRERKLFASIEEFKNLPLVDDELYRKIAPYLKIE